MEEQTLDYQVLHEHYAKVEAENFHLKKQLNNKNKEIKRLKHIIRVWKSRAEESKQKRQHYKNGKRGSMNGR